MKPVYLIIAGTSKAATTSIFNYIADHPEVCGSSIKQTNFFLDSNVQKQINLLSTYEQDKDLVNFEKYFTPKSDERFRLEATPDYINYESTAQALQAFSKNNAVKLIFILRNPVTRFKSWYRFGKQQGDLPEEMSLEEFYKTSKAYTENTNVSLMAYKTGFYTNHLEDYLKYFDKNQIELFFYEDLMNDASSFIKNFCSRLGIDSTFYNEYEFKHFNKTIKTKSKFVNTMYNGIRQFYLKYLFKGFIGVKLGMLFKSILSPLYKKINTKTLKKNTSEDPIVKTLALDYSVEKEKLKNLFNTSNIPWN